MGYQMSDDSQAAANSDSFNTAVQQLSLRMPESEADGEWEIVQGAAELPSEVQQRIKVIAAIASSARNKALR